MTDRALHIVRESAGSLAAQARALALADVDALIGQLRESLALCETITSEALAPPGMIEIARALGRQLDGARLGLRKLRGGQ